MSDQRSAQLDLTYLVAGQLQKHVTLNETLTRLDALVQTAVVSRSDSAQPPEPADGTMWILPEQAAGADWALRPVGTLMRYERGGWVEHPCPDGMMVVVLDEGEVVVRREGAWIALAQTIGTLGNLTRLGIGTTADAANPFAARLNKALWTALETPEGGDGDLRLTLNKQGPADVLSLLFQSAYGGRAELGLIGEDDLTLKVSSDGEAWHEAMRIDRQNGRARFTGGAARAEAITFAEDGTYDIPGWARWVEVQVTGGGGGGGAGAAGPSGSARYGGGGGGAGGVFTASWLAAHVTSPLAIMVGNGGSGGAGAVTAGAGENGTAGDASVVASDGQPVLRALGGEGGLGGTSTAGLGGAGGNGITTGNRGGTSSLLGPAVSGESTRRPDAAGGGGGGAGVGANDIARPGGNGGAGAVMLATASGGPGGTGQAGTAGQSQGANGLSWAGGGGGGGGASATGTGWPGGDGGLFGSGGGGGGGGVGSGGGGDGARGMVRILAIG